MEPWTGVLELHVKKSGNRTIPSHIYCEGALKVIAPVYLDDSGQPCFYLMNTGGGYVDGDRYRLEFRVEEGAEVLLTTQSSTKIYRTEHVAPVQETLITVGRGGLLEYLPDPLIAFQDAEYQQKTEIRLEPGATLVYADQITSGWAPDGSLFRYKRLQLKTEVYLQDELVLYDHLRFQPEEEGMQGIGVLDGNTHVGSLIVIGEQTTPDFLDSLHEELEQEGHGCQYGLSMLRVPGFTLRVLATSTQEIERVFATCQRFLRQEWFGRRQVALRK